MTERTITPWLRWQTIFVLFHYLFSLLIFSLPAQALSPGASGSPSEEVFTSEASPLRDHMAQFWGSAQQSNASDAARGVANSAVNSALTAEVESWLKLGGGKAKVTLDTGIAGSHNRDIGLDYFWPLLDSENSTLFTQLSFHRWNERNQINVGLGYRHDLNDHWMAGGNLFYDRDLSRRHSRLGIGGELWGDGLRTSVNYYHPLSNWRLSHDNNFNDDPLFYDLYERAARGWDLSVEAALSQHVGVKGTWFQWYGDKVDVTGARSQASRDPHGVTLGANWQPVPLLAFNAEHSIISGQDDDTRLGLNLSWQFGRTLDQMLDPAVASALSSLKGERHDFVNRNNNIVLAYQQRENDRHLYFEPSSLTTKAGNTAFTHAVKGGRGGFIVYHSSQPDIAQIVSEQVGTVAPLKRGEVIISAEEYQDASRKKLYDRAEYRLTIQPGDFAPSVMDVRIEGVPAIGSTLNGSYTFISNEGEDEGETTQRWYRQNAPEEVLSTGHQYQQTAADVGRTLVYEVTPVNKAGQRGKPGSAQQAGPQLTLNNLEMTLLQGGGEQQPNGTIKFKAGETGMLLFEATVLDQDGKPVADQPVYWSHNNPNLGKLDETRQMTNGKGQSLVKFSDITHGGDDIIVASLLPDRGLVKAVASTENITTKTLPLSISFSAANKVAFINPPQKVTVGTKTDFTVLVTDEENQTLEDASLQITSNGNTSSVNTDKDGKATFSLVAPLSIDPAQWTVSAALAANSEKGDVAQIDLLADNASAQVASLAANPATAVVDTPVLLTARVQDKHGNPLRGIEVTFLSAANNGVILGKQATDEHGVASYPDYTQTVAQVFHPAAQLGTGVAKETTVTFTADKVTTLTLQRNFSGELAADGTPVSWTATAKDAHNNPVVGAPLVWKVTGPLGEITPEKEDITNHQGDALLTVALPKIQGDLKVEVESGNAQQQDSITLKPVLTLASLEPSSDKPVVGGQVIMTAQVTNLAGDPLENVLVDFTNNQNARMTEQRGVRTDINGLAQATLEIIKGQEQGAAGDYDVKATLSAKPSDYKTATVSWQLDNAAARVTQLSASPTSARVGSKVQLTATVNDPFGNPVSGAQVEFLSDAQRDDVLTTVTSNDQGIAVWADYSQTAAQVYKPAARVVGGAAQDTSVTFTVDVVASLELTPNFNGDLLADGVTEASWTVTAKDRYHNLVPEAPLAWTVTGPGGNISSQIKDDKTQTNGAGQVTIVLPKKQGAVKVEVSSGAEKTEDSVMLQPVLTLKSLEADNPRPVVGGQVTMTAYVTNLAGDPLTNVLVNFANNHNAWMTEQSDVKTDANGMALAVLKIREGKEVGAPGNYLVTATLQEKPSETKQETVTWVADLAEAQVTELHANPTTAVAGSKVQLTATVKDRFGNPVKGGDVEFLSAASQGEVLTTLTTNGKGEVVWTEYTQTTAGEYAPAARVVNGIAQATTVNFSADPASAKVVAVKANPVTATAGSDVLLTATIQDQYGNLVKNGEAMVSFLASKAGAILGEPVATNEVGEANFSNYRQQAAGNYYPAARVGGGTAIDTRVTYTAGTVTTLKLQPDFAGDLQADGNSQVSWTVTAQDAHGNPVPDAPLTWEITGPAGNIIPTKDEKTNAQGKGVATVTLPGEQGELEAVVKSGNVQDDDSTTLLPVLQLKSLTSDTTNPQLGGSVTLTAKVVNQAGTALANVVVDFTNDRANVMEQALNVKTDSNGEAKATLKILSGQELGAPGSYVVKATLKDKTSEFKETTITWQPGSGQVTGLTANPTSAAAGNDVQLTATVQDQFGNKVKNVAVTFLSSLAGNALGEAVHSNAEGISIFNYQQSTAGAYRPAASAGNGEGKDTPVSIWGTPSIESVIVTPNGNVEAGTTLTASTQGFDAQGTGEEASLYQWFYRTESKPEWTKIDNATAETFATSFFQVGYEFKVIVTPKGSLQVTEGQPKESAVVRLYGKPSIASVNVTPSSSVRVNNPLFATYSGFNAQGTGEDNSLYQWYYRTSPTDKWIVVATAKEKQYTPDNVRLGNQVRVGVTPKGSEQDVTGTEIYSDPISVHGTPSIDGISVTPNGAVQQGQTLTAVIRGFNANATGSDDSRYQWFYRWKGTTSWIEIDKAQAKTYTLGDDYVGHDVQVRVTPKGSDYAITGIVKSSDPIYVYGTPSIESVAVTPTGSVTQSQTLTAIINGFDAQGTGTNASLYQWSYRRAADQDWIKVDKAEQQTFNLANILPGYQVRVAVTPKGSEQVITGVLRYSDPVTVAASTPTPGAPVIVDRDLTYYAKGTIFQGWIYDMYGTVKDDVLNQPVQGVGVCFRLFNLQTGGFEIFYDAQTDRNGVAHIKDEIGRGKGALGIQVQVGACNPGGWSSVPRKEEREI